MLKIVLLAILTYRNQCWQLSVWLRYEFSFILKLAWMWVEWCARVGRLARLVLVVRIHRTSRIGCSSIAAVEASRTWPPAPEPGSQSQATTTSSMILGNMIFLHLEHRVNGTQKVSSGAKHPVADGEFLVDIFWCLAALAWALVQGWSSQCEGSTRVSRRPRP